MKRHSIIFSKAAIGLRLYIQDVDATDFKSILGLKKKGLQRPWAPT
jgi:hypothetical protein